MKERPTPTRIADTVVDLLALLWGCFLIPLILQASAPGDSVFGLGEAARQILDQSRPWMIAAAIGLMVAKLGLFLRYLTMRP
jgi:hypothetical protein